MVLTYSICRGPIGPWGLCRTEDIHSPKGSATEQEPSTESELTTREP